MKIVVLLALLTVPECSSRVVGQAGQDVTLTCSYDIESYGPLTACWTRGQVPALGCSPQLVSTDGHKVTEGTRASSRYQILGPLEQGDVSLTILNITGSDAGLYGCRVAVPGMFNDAKHHFDLTVETGAQTTSSAAPHTHTQTSTAANHTAGHVTSTESFITSSFSSVEAEQEVSVVAVVLVCVLFGSLVLVTAGGLVVIARRWRRVHKMSQQQVISSVLFSPISSTLQLHTQASAVENIYQLDGGEYESCP